MTVGHKHPVRGPLGLPKLDCLERVVEVVSLVLVAPTESTSEVLDEGKDFSILALFEAIKSSELLSRVGNFPSFCAKSSLDLLSLANVSKECV